MYTTTLSNQEIAKIKVLDLSDLYNFEGDNFFRWNHLLFQNLISSC